jgi:Spy/CpxP family protein refolding chaperone
MKILSTLTLGALLITGAAFAATAPAASAPTATPATQVQPAQKHNSAMHCEKQAREKKLTGEAEKEFVKECREGKKAN